MIVDGRRATSSRAGSSEACTTLRISSQAADSLSTTDSGSRPIRTAFSRTSWSAKLL